MVNEDKTIIRNDGFRMVIKYRDPIEPIERYDFDILGKRGNEYSTKKLVDLINKHGIVKARRVLVNDDGYVMPDDCNINCENQLLLTLGNGEIVCFYDGEYGGEAAFMRVFKLTNYQR